MNITPKNWKSFQHYKDRAPAWIKLHRGLLDDFEFCCLPVASRALAPFLWLLASEYEDGKITATLDELAFRFRMTRGDVADALSPLVQSGFFDASEPLAERKQSACLEREEEEEDIEKRKRENGAVAPPDPAVPERAYFERGKEVLGSSAGGLINKLLKAKGGNVALARAAVEQASQKQNPTEYVAAICRGPPIGKPLTEYQRAQHETKGILDELDNFARGGSQSSQDHPRLLSNHSGERSESIRGGSGSDIIDLPRSRSSAGG